MRNKFVLIFMSLLILSMTTSCNSKLQASQTKDNTEANLIDDKTRPQPNVVLLLADDLGWQDVKCYDIDAPSPYETPHIDRLAKEGTMFWQAYSPAPTCAPSRCAIMSGNHPARAQKTHVVGGAPPVAINKNSSRMMSPWYSGRMPADEMTLARALKANNYTTGHSGKWHMAISHKAFPQPEDQGFDYTRSDRGVANRIRPTVMSDFSTDDPNDEFPIDENGFIVNPTTQDALAFLKEAKDKPFFLYYAEWLVHGPIQTRNRRLLDKYSEKLDVEVPHDPKYGEGTEGQNNPFYCAMVEEFDNYVGQVVHYLKTTDDPRWPGHKLYENTYFIFTSDNGGMEKHPGGTTTDNYPLDRGKISAMEGGTRVPLIITGPGIKAGIKSDVMVNGLDFYPTILALTGTEKPAGKNFDGCDISTLLLKDATNAKLVKDEKGKERKTMMFHFPNSIALESTIRNSDYKLIRNYDHLENESTVELELYRLYETKGGKSDRVDIEEAKNLASEMPDLTNELNGELTKMLTEMDASYPYYNPTYNKNMLNKATVPTVLSDTKDGNKVTFKYQENGAKVVKANLLYTLNGGAKYEEWFRASADLSGNNTATATLPEGTTHYYINLIDEHNFLVSYPQTPDGREMKKLVKESKRNKGKYSLKALSAK